MLKEITAKQYVKQIQNGDKKAEEEFLIILKDLIEKIISHENYKICGYEKEDIIQICWIKSWEFINKFDFSKNTKFIPVLKIVINNHLKDILRKLYYKKREIDLYTDYYSNIRFRIKDDFPTDLDRLILKNELENYLKRLKEKLSIGEFACYSLKVQGYSYDEISRIVFKGNRKQVDNSLMRARRKIKKIDPIDFSCIPSVDGGKKIFAKNTEEISYTDYDPDAGSYSEIAKKILGA